MKYLYLLSLFCIITSCEEKREKVSSEERQKISEIIDKTIEAAGGEKYKKASITFEFRGDQYTSKRGRGEFYLEKETVVSGDTILDIVSNTGYKRLVNDSLVSVPDSLEIRYSTDVKTVHYFAHLPFGLEDRALSKDLVGVTEIKGEPYYELKMTFQHDASGANHDEFMFWIHKKDFTLDYLAYKFWEHEDGIRFRAAYDPEIRNGIRFTDYKNYTTPDFNTPLEDLDELYEAGKLELVSNIETEIKSVKIQK